MTKLDRKTAPAYNLITKINYNEIKKHKLDNGIEVFELNSNEQNILKLELNFKVGSCNSDNILTSAITNTMLRQATKSKTSSQIEEKLDYYGSFVNSSSGKHFSSVQLYSLSSHFENSLEIVEDIVKNPTFPEHEFLIEMQNNKQQYIEAKDKVDYMSNTKFTKTVFGEKHPYGKILNLEYFEKLKINELKTFYKRYYNSDNCIIVIAGKTNDDTLKILNKKFGQNDWRGKNNIIKEKYPLIEIKKQKIIVKKKDAVQSSLVIGCRTISKKHEDFHGLNILNAILGGYFGSRLMLSIREKQALTYGIYSYVNSLLFSGIFAVSANVSKGNEEKVISEIYKEMNILKEKKISKSELELVRNYLMGEMQRAFDGPFNQSEIFLNLKQFGLNYSYFDDYINTIKNIDANNILELANKYFNENKFIEVLAGDL